MSASSAQQFGPGFFTRASTLPFFSEDMLEQVDNFVEHYEFAKNALGYSKRILRGIMFKETYVGRANPALEVPFSKCIQTIVERVRMEFGNNMLEMLSLEFTNQAFKHKSRWHKDLDDGFPYLNVFIPLDDINEVNGMTILKVKSGTKIELNTPRNHWYSFDGSITHCAGAGNQTGIPRRALMAVFRLSSDPEPATLATARYKSVITRRLNISSGFKRSRPEPIVPTRVLRSRVK